KTRQLSALNTLITAATRSLDLHSILQEAAKSIIDLFHFDGARVYLLDESMDALHLTASFQGKLGPFSSVGVARTEGGLIGRVAKTGEMLIFEDIQTDPRYEQLSQSRRAKAFGARFFAGLPIQSKLKSWGTLVCIGEEKRRLSIEETDLLMTLCNHVAIAIENATLFQQAAEKAKELSALYSVAASCAEVLDVNALLRQNIRKALEIFGFSAARVFIVDKKRREIRLVAADGFAANIVSPNSYQLGEGLVGKVVETGLPLTFEDMQCDPDYRRLAQAKTMLKAGFRASIFIPLRVRGETLGVMNLVSKDPHTFSTSDMQLINAIAYHLGIAIGNANIFSELRQKTLDLERANKAKDEFLSVMSHELRTPLNVIMGYVQLIQDEAFGNLSAGQQRAFTAVTKQTKGLLTMIEEILVTTTIESGSVKLDCKNINITEFFDELRSAYELAPRKDFRLVWDIPSDLPPLNSDERKLKHILQNLINNAVKFTDKGRVTISVRNDTGLKAMEFSVEDTGIGIEREDVPAIFKMFQQVDSSKTRIYGGVGLGLYIVKKFTELLGGTVTVDSEPGEGSIFRVTIPFI
ncbi:MAG TPA: GAF domain-containing protein, partial [Terriglobales bacterium]|nr:GAF domain-containing protein [Terriglobales bacterium]